LVQAIRDIYNFFWDKTGVRYTKTLLSDAYQMFLPDPKLILPEPVKLIVPEKTKNG
jgi:hypothetical protein